MIKYKLGDKIILTVTGTNEMGCLPCYVLNDDLILSKQDIDKYAEPLTAYTEPLEDKIRKQETEIRRLVEENERLIEKNKKLKSENEKMLVKLAAYELYGDQHEEEYNQAFNQGAEAAWELARKIAVIPKDGGYGGSKLIEIFNTALNNEIFNLTYSEATAKVAEWEKAKEEIKAGDIVRCKSDTPVEFCVTEISCHGRLFGIGRNGGTYSNKNPKDWEKTGRHIDIDSFLKQIGGEQE